MKVDKEMLSREWGKEKIGRNGNKRKKEKKKKKKGDPASNMCNIVSIQKSTRDKKGGKCA